MTTSKNQRFFSRLRFALAGVAHGLRTERSLQTQMLALWFALIALVYLRPAPIWWALVWLTCTAVLTAELLNTAIEQLADHLHPEQHAAIQRVKDCAAGAVLMMCVGAVGVGIALVVATLHHG